MKSGYKILSIFLSLLMILSMAVGCTPSTDADETTGNLSDTAIESTTSEETESEASTDTSADTSEETTEEAETEAERVGSVSILNGPEITLEVGEQARLTVYKSSFIKESVVWTADRGIIDLEENGLVTALEVGIVTVTASAGKATDSIRINVVEKPEETTAAPDTDTEADTETEPGNTEFGDRHLETVPPDEIYEAVHSTGQRPAESYEEALNRTQNHQLSGYDFVPDRHPFSRNTAPCRTVCT